MNFTIKNSDDLKYDWDVNEVNNSTEISVKGAEISDTKIIIKTNEFEYTADDNGFFLVPDTPQKGSFTISFKNLMDCEYEISELRMPMFAISGRKSYLVIGVGMKNHMQIVTGVKNNKYYIYPQFDIDGFGMYEKPSIKIIELDPYCSVADIARRYREYQLENGCIPIAKRIEKSEVLKYMSDAIEVRIRMGWKPVPSPIEHQTEENEPEMFVACDFDRVSDLINEMKAQGIEKAHITLVGWNKSGHDGRWPQIFPVDDRLGGELKLKELIAHASDCGYLISCHTNSTDAYSIANNWNKNTILRKENGDLDIGYVWSGGRAHIICPKCARKTAELELPNVKDVGFTGGLYVDVLTAKPPMACFDEMHPCTKVQCVKEYRSIMQLSRELFGAFQSEGGFLYAPDMLDYAFYACHKENIFDNGDEFFDYEVPLWQMVYNGIILSNAYTNTANCTIKGEATVLKAIEYGSRQSFYLYSKFMKGSDQDDWLGSNDLMMRNDEELRYTVSKIKEGYDIFTKMSGLNKCFIDDYIIEGDIHKVFYSDGTVVSVDYDKLTYSIE